MRLNRAQGGENDFRAFMRQQAGKMRQQQVETHFRQKTDGGRGNRRKIAQQRLEQRRERGGVIEALEMRNRRPPDCFLRAEQGANQHQRHAAIR